MRLSVFVFCFVSLLISFKWASAAEVNNGPIVQFFSSEMVTTKTKGKPTLVLHDSLGIINAMARGDTERLRKICETLKGPPSSPNALNDLLIGLCKAALARTQGNFALSNTILHEAMDKAQPWGNPNLSINPFNIEAVSMGAGNFMLSGQTSVWVDSQYYLGKTFIAPVRIHYSIPDLQFPDMSLIRVTASPADVPVVAGSGPLTDHVEINPFATMSGNQAIRSAKINITLDGMSTSATLSTGTVLGAVPAAMQRIRHWQEIGFLAQEDGGPAPSRATQLVLIPSLTLGHTVLRNQLMFVIPGNDVIIGLQTLGALRHVVMTDQSMTFGPNAPFACHHPVHLQSDISGLRAHILLPVSYRGKTVMAAVATGDNNPQPLAIMVDRFPSGLLGSRLAPTTQGKTDGVKTEQALLFNTEIKIDKHIVHDQIRYRIGSPSLTPILTMAALENAKFSFDLHEGVACLD